MEEEFFLVDPVHHGPVPLNREVVAAAGELGVDLQLELSACQVETNTAVCHGMTELRAQVLHLRTAAAAAAVAVGARLAVVGVPAAGRPLYAVTDKPRYQRMAARYGSLLTEQVISGCHVHVGMSDRETAVVVGNHLRPWLPALLALTANSAVHHGRDTGFASWRSTVVTQWPCSGPPPFFASAADYDAHVAMLVGSGAIMDLGMVYWDVRPSAHLPTIEVRVSDVPATVDETVLLATLIRGLVAAATRAVCTGDLGPSVDQETLRVARFRAALQGLSGTTLDVRSGRHVTTTQHLAALLRHIRPDLEEFGEYSRTANLLRRVLAHGNGAARQRAALARGCSPGELVS